MNEMNGTLRDEIRISKRTFEEKKDLVKEMFSEFAKGFYWIPTKLMNDYLETRLRAFQSFNDDLRRWNGLFKKDIQMLDQYIAAELLGIISCSEFGKLKEPLNLHSNYGVRIPGFLHFSSREFRKVVSEEDEILDQSESELDDSSSCQSQKKPVSKKRFHKPPKVTEDNSKVKNAKGNGEMVKGNSSKRVKKNEPPIEEQKKKSDKVISRVSLM